MKSYKEYGKQYVGMSDIASLLVRDPDGCFEISLGFDGSYEAYLVDEDAEIGEHYTLVHTSRLWAWVYDDLQRRLEVNAGEIRFYRAGGGGLIIQAIGK